MRIFRVQNARGDGPYQGGIYWEHEMSSLFSEEERIRIHPTPYAEPMLNFIDTDEVCAFATFKAYRSWFRKPVLKAFLCHNPEGYGLYEYEVPAAAVRVGERQVLVKTLALGKPVAVHDLRNVHRMV